MTNTATDTATVSVADVEETIPWRPGMCRTPDCGRLVPELEAYCAPCAVLFGPYDELLRHDDVEEWIPEDHPSEPEPKPVTESENS